MLPCSKKHGGSGGPDALPVTHGRRNPPHGMRMFPVLALSSPTRFVSAKHDRRCSKFSGPPAPARLRPARWICQPGSDGSRERVRRLFIALRLKTCVCCGPVLWVTIHMGHAYSEHCRFEKLRVPTRLCGARTGDHFSFFFRLDKRLV